MKHPRRPRDPNVRAKLIVDLVTGERSSGWLSEKALAMFKWGALFMLAFPAALMAIGLLVALVAPWLLGSS